jgi:hypothetical protein
MIAHSYPKEEFAAYAQTRMEYSDAFVILPDDVWNSFDEDGDDSLSVTEFMSAVSAFDTAKLKARRGWCIRFKKLNT